MTKLVADFKYGTLSAGIGSTDTTITSAEFADLPVVSSPDTMDLVLNPGEVGGDAEIVTVTAHTSASTSVTVAARTGSAHGSGTQWVHAVTAADFNRMGFDGTLEGNADTATALETARTIGGVSFDGTANINLPGVNTAGNQDTSGNAATATALETARTINGTSFDGTANITVTAAAGTLTGGTLNSGVTASSLTSVGTLTSLDISGDLSFGTPANGSRQVRLYETGSAGYGIGTDVNRVTIFASNSSTYAERMIINSSGNVGIGTTSPPGHLQVASQNRAVSVLDYGTNNYAELGFTSLGSDGPAFGILSGYHIYFRTGTTRGGLASNMILNSSGDLGVGTTSPGFKLDVNGNLRSQSYVVIESGTNDKLRLTANTTGNRPYLSFNNWNGSSYVRRGYIGYPNAGSSTSTINLVSDNGNVQITGSGGEVNVSPKLSINNGPELSDPGSANNLRVTTAYGYLDLGPQNSSYCHIYTDRTRFYLNKGIDSSPYYYWRNSSGIGGPLTDTSTGTGYRYVFQNQTYGTFFDYSSIRARKEQIVNVTEADAGRWIDALQPVTFIERWMGEGEEPEDNKRFREADMQVGFIADDILDNPDTTHFSQVIDNGEGGFDPAGWKWECVIATCVAEIKSLRARVAELEAG